MRAYTLTRERRGRMYRIWYWAMIDRETSGRFVASIPDLGDWRLMATRTRMPWLM